VRGRRRASRLGTYTASQRTPKIGFGAMSVVSSVRASLELIFWIAWTGLILGVVSLAIRMVRALESIAGDLRTIAERKALDSPVGGREDSP